MNIVSLPLHHPHSFQESRLGVGGGWPQKLIRTLLILFTAMGMQYGNVSGLATSYVHQLKDLSRSRAGHWSMSTQNKHVRGLADANAISMSSPVLHHVDGLTKRLI